MPAKCSGKLYGVLTAKHLVLLDLTKTAEKDILEPRSSLTDSCMSGGLVFWQGTERLENWGDHPHHKKGGENHISLLSLTGKVRANALKKCREIIERKQDDTQCGFCPGCSTTDQIFTLQQIFEKSWEYAKDVYTPFVDHEKAYDRLPREKLLEVLREYGVDGRLLLAAKSLDSCSETCARVGGITAQPSTVGAGLRQSCVCSSS